MKGQRSSKHRAAVSMWSWSRIRDHSVESLSPSATEDPPYSRGRCMLNMPLCHTPGLDLQTTVVRKCPSSPKDEQEKQAERRDRQRITFPSTQRSCHAGDCFKSASRPSDELWNSCTVEIGQDS
ncbi:hypothetical protein TNCV_5100041 [Trichonephila clavipes]|uniref:Uncharacterized protein n=1 Tax=Trichonephila clavipes TaxID=2585209 RepID=A0A8X6RZN7_TRICX|nr:hypothetical protein TNCV_5100041 [Trichonephila clavipes]